MATNQANPVEIDLGYEQVACDTATGLAAIPADASGDPVPCIATCQCDPEANIAVRWRADGTSPTTAIGNVIRPGEEREFVASLGQLKFIGVSAGALVNVNYGPYPPALS